MIDIVRNLQLHTILIRIGCDECHLIDQDLASLITDPERVGSEALRLRFEAHRYGWRRRTRTEPETGRPTRADLCPVCRRTLKLR